MKRVFDAIISSLGLLLLGPVFLIIALMIKLDSRGPVFFKQARIGREFRPFFIYKFRTMIADSASTGGALTVGRDPRITRAGDFLRATKIDEIPQLINILKGDMSFVGPRPEVPEFVELFRSDYEEILRVRPGLTDLASLKYRNEAMTLAQTENPHEDYLKRVLPDKIRLAKEYIRRSSLLFDLGLIFRTVAKLFDCKPSR
jgi:lipopolysaccharide/colanic/teichoic acid biosynthesis glycosyltransferase